MRLDKFPKHVFAKSFLFRHHILHLISHSEEPLSKTTIAIAGPIICQSSNNLKHEQTMADEGITEVKFVSKRKMFLKMAPE